MYFGSQVGGVYYDAALRSAVRVPCDLLSAEESGHQVARVEPL